MMRILKKLSLMVHYCFYVKWALTEPCTETNQSLTKDHSDWAVWQVVSRSILTPLRFNFNRLAGKQTERGNVVISESAEW